MDFRGELMLLFEDNMQSDIWPKRAVSIIPKRRKTLIGGIFKHPLSFYWMFSLFFFPMAQIQANPPRPLTINVFSVSNGSGLEAHRKILRKALESLGHKVLDRDLSEKPNKLSQRTRADINIFIERILPEWVGCAKLNWLIPHAEWYAQDVALLDKVDLILCLTHEAEGIFQELGKPHYYLGFTSIDCYNPQIGKNFDLFLHTAGNSYLKGTNEVIEVWKHCRSYPLLTLTCRWLTSPPFIQENVKWIFERVPENNLRHLQNNCGIHLCPSATEGFGHYIMEAMSVGAVVISTDAPPMNEFIADKRCLVPYQRTEKMNLATLYFIAPLDVERTIDHLRTLSPSERKKIGENNRSMYLQKTNEFHNNLRRLLEGVN